MRGRGNIAVPLTPLLSSPLSPLSSDPFLSISYFPLSSSSSDPPPSHFLPPSPLTLSSLPSLTLSLHHPGDTILVAADLGYGSSNFTGVVYIDENILQYLSHTEVAVSYGHCDAFSSTYYSVILLKNSSYYSSYTQRLLYRRSCCSTQSSFVPLFRFNDNILFPQYFRVFLNISVYSCFRI